MFGEANEKKRRIVLFLIGVTPLHKFWGISDPMMQPMQMVPFMKNIAMLGAALLMTQFGSGPWSLDPVRSKSLEAASLGNETDP